MENLGAVIGGTSERHDNTTDDNIARSPITPYQIQYRARGLYMRDLDEDTQERSRMAMQELVSLANGLEDEDVEVTLRQGSLIIDAKVHMPTAAGTPVAPTSRAVGKIPRDITQTYVSLDDPKLARCDTEDELWRTGGQGGRRT